VFPRKTKATPDDDFAVVGMPTLFSQADRVHVSVTFSYDLPYAERLAKEWSAVAPVEIGGPATGEAGGDFVPGMYLKKGYVITSRGCPNRCWFCSVWRREGETVRELPITEGYNILDDNILATSQDHFLGVCEMLKRQKERAEFTGGLEAARLTQWHVDRLKELRIKQMFFAYDGPEDRDPLHEAMKLLHAAGFTGKRHELRSYVLIGYPKDTFEAAEIRLKECLSLGVLPMAMLYRDQEGGRDRQWMKFQRLWARPNITATLLLKNKDR